MIQKLQSKLFQHQPIKFPQPNEIETFHPVFPVTKKEVEKNSLQKNMPDITPRDLPFTILP